MKRAILNVFLLFAITSLTFASAMAEGFRIAYVDGDKLVLESPQYQSLQKNLEADFKRRDNELLAKQAQVEKLIEKLDRDGLTMSDSERTRLESDIRSRKHKLKGLLEEYREEFNIKRGEAREQLQREVSEVIQQVGKSEGYDMILSAGVVYYSDNVDITNKVLDRLKRDFKNNNK